MDPFRAHHLTTVAEYLLDEDAGNPADWVEIAEGRYRSAVGRGYYSLVLAIREAVIGARPAFEYPTKRTGEILRRATENALGVDHEVSKALGRLMEHRHQADYELSRKLVSANAAWTIVDQADAAVKAVAALDRNQVENLIVQIGRARRDLAARR